MNFERLEFDVDIGKYTYLLTSNKTLVDSNALDISRIMMTYQNINEVFNLLIKRNEMMTEANHLLLSSSHKQPVMVASPEAIMSALTPLKASYLFFITEQIINYIDYMLIEISTWKNSFPREVSKILDLKYLKRLDLGLIQFPEVKCASERNELFNVCPKLDFNKASELTGFTPEELTPRIFFHVVEKFHDENENKDE